MAARKHEYRYYLPEQGEGPDDARLLIWEPSEPEDIALECAGDWHRNGSGWEASWPNIFVVLHQGVEIVRCSIDREMVPEFYIDDTV